jgi:HAD superfamily hydrolase (TIGR01490 family)
MAMQLAIFDLDGTLLTGDSDTLWCRFLHDLGEIDAGQAERCAAVATRYAAGTVVPEDYCLAQAALLAGRSAESLQPLRERFLAEVIRPRVPHAARELLQRHRDDGDTLLLTTATSRVVSEFTAADLGVHAYLCTELDWTDGLCSGRLHGGPNMRSGKVERVRAWLAQRGEPDSVLRRATFYSDSINDLALLSVVGRPVVVDPDVRLAATAMRKGWTMLNLHHRERQVDTVPA